VNRDYPDRPFVAALAVCRRGDRVLLAQRSKGPVVGKWGFPGGLQELSETIAAAARRELKEETGIEAEPVGVIDAIDVIARDGEDRLRSHFTLVCVLLDWVAGEGAPIEDATAVGWFNAAEAEALDDRFPDTMRLLHKALAR
jgi:8-oxo-dGTP diphosphatase